MENAEKSSQNTVITDESLAEEYNKLFKTFDHTISIRQQWSKPGDIIQKFSIYENYTPVKTSGSTTLINKL